MAARDIVTLVLWALGSAAADFVVALVVLRRARRSSLLAQVLIVVVASLAAVVIGMTAVAHLMYVSGHDFEVFLWLVGVAGGTSLVLAGILGLSLVRNGRRLVAQARALGETTPAPAAAGARESSNEFDRVGRELAASDRRLFELREREARADGARRELVAWISHDLRTPLAGLRAMAEALEDGLVDDPNRYHRQMLTQVDRLSTMVDDLFELSTLNAGALRLDVRRVTSRELMDGILAELETVAARRDVTLAIGRLDDVTFEADPDELGRAVTNLVMNSIRFSPPESTITLSALARGSELMLSVEDSGGGIDEEDLGRIFEPGFQASASRTTASDPLGPGAGLGLAIVQGIVSLHQGRVDVVNVGTGSRFDIVVPKMAHRLER